MKYLKKIWDFINSRAFVFVLLGAFILFIAITCKRKHDIAADLARTEQNNSALHDSLKLEKIKGGQLIVSISGYIASEKELKTLNKDLWEKVKGQNGSILSLNHTIMQLNQDTTKLRKYLVEKDKKIATLLKLDSNTYAAEWSLNYRYDSTNFDIFTGKTDIRILNKNPIELVHVNTELTNKLSQIDLIWGQKVEDDKLRVYVQSAYPGFTVQSMEGVLIDPNKNPLIKEITKKKHWFQGLSIGFGITPGWDFLSNKGAVVIGPTLSYSIYTW